MVPAAPVFSRCFAMAGIGSSPGQNWHESDVKLKKIRIHEIGNRMAGNRITKPVRILLPDILLPIAPVRSHKTS